MTKAEAMEMIGNGFLELAKAMAGDGSVVESKTVAKKVETSGKAETPAAVPAESAKEEKQYRMEEVRAMLARKSSEGFTAQVRQILEKHGGSKLSKVDPSEYAAVMEEAKKLGGGA